MKVIRGLIVAAACGVIGVVGSMHGVTLEKPEYWVVTVALLVIIFAS